MITPVFQNQDWNDLVFENRNKEYGAYVLRMEHEKNMGFGLLFSLSLLGAIVIYALISSHFNPVQGCVISIPEVPPVIIDKPNIVIKEKELAKKLEPIASQRVNQVIYTNPQVVPDNVATDPLASQETLLNVEAGTANVTDGAASGLNPSTDDLPGDISDELGSTENSSQIHIAGTLNKEPMFPGGMEALNKFLAGNIKFTSQAIDGNIAGNVWLSFVIDENGTPQNIKVERGLCCGLNENAVNVIRAMPAWSPGFMGNMAVKVKYSLKVAYRLK